MKELDLQNATLLKKFLGVNYDNYDIKHCQDICTLTRMCLVAMVCWSILVVLGVLVLGVLSVLLTAFSLITLFFPEGYQAPLFILELGAVSLGVITGLGCIFTIAAAIMTSDGQLGFAPEYMKRPLRKLFKKKLSSEVSGDTLPKEKVPSQTWIAIKEMYKSVKENTCIKVRM